VSLSAWRRHRKSKLAAVKTSSPHKSRSSRKTPRCWSSPNEPEYSEEPLTSVSPSSSPVTYCIFEDGSQREKPKLIDSLGYTYVIHRPKKSGRVWRCSVRNSSVKCSASVSQDMEDNTFTRNSTPHIHEPCSMAMERVQITIEARKVGKMPGRTTTSFSEAERIVRQHIDGRDPPPLAAVLPTYANVAQRINYHKGKRYPKHPRRISKFKRLSKLYVRPSSQFIRGPVRVVSQRRKHIIMYTRKQKKLLKRARAWYIDATFRIVKKPFKQLLGIHVFVRVNGKIKMEPVGYVIMSGRSTEDYEVIFRHFKSLRPRVKEIVMDFEPAEWKGLKRVFPRGVKLRGCLFHYRKAIFKKMVNLGFLDDYHTNRAVSIIVKKLMALPCLPLRHIVPAFRQLRRTVDAADERLNALFKYVDSTWIRSTIHPPRAWCVHRALVRTNNDVEGWHSRINRYTRGTAGINLYRLIDILYAESMKIEADIGFMAGNMVMRKRTRLANTAQRLLQGHWAANRGNHMRMLACIAGDIGLWKKF